MSPKILNTIGYYAAFLVLGSATAALGPTLPGLAENTGASLSGISFLFMAHSLGYLFGSIQGGWLYDRTPGHRVMAGALAAIAATLALVPLIPRLWLLALVWLVLGAAGGALDVGGNTLLVWVHRREVGPFMNGLHFFFGAGAFVAPLIIARLLPAGGGVTWAYWALAVLALPAMAWLVRLPSPPPEIESQANPARNTRPRLVLLFALLFFLYVGGEVSFGGWVFTYAVALDLGGAAAAAYLTSAFWGAFTAGRLLAIPVAARVRPRHLLLGSFAGCLASLAAVLLWPASTVALWAGALGLGLSMAPVFPASFSLAERHMSITGQVSGWFLVGASLGAMSLPWLIGQLFERVGPHVTMLAILIDVILTLGVFAALLLHLGRRAPEQQATHL